MRTKFNKIKFNYMNKKIKLKSGYEMPLNGIGTNNLIGEDCYKAVIKALSTGIRLIDTSYKFDNEKEVGRAIRDSGIPREEIFVITKIQPDKAEEVEEAVDKALENLNIEYIDMILLHYCMKEERNIEIYNTVREKYVKTGKVHCVGLTNWYIERLEKFLPYVDTAPDLVQNEIHPYYQELDVVMYVQSKGIAIQGWYTFGGRNFKSEILGDRTITRIAKAHNVSAAQVILRWNLQRGVNIIPGSKNKRHINQNAQIYHFELTEEEMGKIKKLNRNEKHGVNI